jgi:cytochrome c
MLTRKPVFFLTTFISFVPFVLINPASTEKKRQQENHPPVVKIISPKNNSLFDYNTQLTYSITVSDKEDGESKFDEINTKEVLLEVRYIDDHSKQQVPNKMQNDPPALVSIRTSNCFNCHSFNSKSSGPSFYDISKRYKATSQNIMQLVKHTREGSTGIWGKERMPTHLELSNDQTKKIIEWILKNSTAPNTNYYIGTEGSFRINPVSGLKRKATYMLTASYIDHGLKGSNKQHLKGQDVIFIQSR